jgi:hypothetical protein
VCARAARRASAAWGRARLVAAALILAALGAAPTRALAHHFDDPKRLRVRLEPTRLELTATYDVDPGARALELRRIFDRDRDGRLGPEERAVALDYLTRTALLFTRLEVDGVARPLLVEPRGGLEPGERAGAGTASIAVDREARGLEQPTDATTSIGILVVVRVPLASPPRALTIRDRGPRPERGVPTTIELRDLGAPRLASQGEWIPRTRSLVGLALAEDEPLVLVLGAGPPP